jgi:tellurite resistance protein TerB
MLGALLNKFKPVANKYNGRRDVLEAMCAAMALGAAADGNVSDDEIANAIDTAKASPILAASFTQSEIETEIDRQLKRVKTMSGRVQLQRELDDCAKMDQNIREDIFLAAYDIVAGDGNIEPKEREALNKIAGRLNVDPKKFDL